MKKLIFLPIFFLIMVLSQEGIAQDLTCTSCKPIVKLTKKPTTIANSYTLLTADEQGNSYVGNPILGQLQKQTGTTALQYALTPEEIKEFVKKHGIDYLNLFSSNYFLTISGNEYGFTIVDRQGNIIGYETSYATIPADAEFLSIFMKKIKKS